MRQNQQSSVVTDFMWFITRSERDILQSWWKICSEHHSNKNTNV